MMKLKGYSTKPDLFCFVNYFCFFWFLFCSFFGLFCYCFVYIWRASSLDKNKVNAILAFLKSICLSKDNEINITMTEFQNINKIKNGDYENFLDNQKHDSDNIRSKMLPRSEAVSYFSVQNYPKIYCEKLKLM